MATSSENLDEFVQPVMLAVVAGALIVVTTLFHYLTDMHDVAFHNVYRRVYYVPIVLAAFAYGTRGGLAASLLAALAYMPHAFFMTHRDPAPAVDKVLEIVLYIGIGLLAGWLVDRQKRAQRQLEHSLERRDELETQLVRAAKLGALGNLTAGLAHEIRNPLASILGSAEALAGEFGPEHRKHKMGELLLKEINRLNKVVTDFLDFARPSELEVEIVEIPEVVGEVVQLTSHASREAGVEVDVQVKTGRVRADRDQLAQVMLNLLLNAYQAVDEVDEPCVRVVSRTRTMGGETYTCIGVADNGPGVDDEFVEKVFEPYYTSREGGTGLGLSISSTIMERHGGFLDLERDGDETIMWMCFPEARDA